MAISSSVVEVAVVRFDPIRHDVSVHADVEKLYFEALEQTQDQRDAYLVRAASGNEVLLAEVRALLAVDEASDHRLKKGVSRLQMKDFVKSAGDLQSIGHYHLLSEIGRGGMGVVYLAEDTKLDRRVAIKALPLHLVENDQRLAWFLREAKTLALLNHHSIASIYGLQEQGGQHFLVLEYVDGETLKALMRLGTLKVEQMLGIARDLAEAIEYAHETGVVHCDLKPANVMVERSGATKVLDFGLARAFHEPATAPRPASGRSPVFSTHSSSLDGGILGTPGYLAPEQARGEAPSRHADIFSFGVIFYELLTGVSPFKADSIAETFAATLRTEPDFTIFPPEVPDSIQTLVKLCLSKSPSKRIQHMGDCRLLIDDALGKGDVASIPSAGVTESEPVVERFRISESICRLLDRERLDPRLIGSELLYLDNHHSSDTLVFFLHAVGRDHNQWREHLRAIPYRGMAPTLVGFEPTADVRLRLSMRDHLIILREFMRSKTEEHRPRITIATAHSAGADLVMRMICEIEDHKALPIDGLLPLEPNLGLATCQVTQQMAAFDTGQEDEILKRLHGFSDVPESLDDWIILYDYLAEIIYKFRNDIGTLRDFGKEIIAPFESDGPVPFLAWYRAAIRAVPHVRCIFSETPVYNERILKLRLDHFDNECFGPDHREESIHIARGTTHLDLYHVKRIRHYLQEMVQQISDSKAAR